MRTVRTRSIMERLSHSEAPFCSGVRAVVDCQQMPSSFMNVVQTFEKYSPPLSVLKVRRDLLDSFSTWVFHCLNTVNASFFRRRKYTQTQREKSSVKVIIYWEPDIDWTGAGPQRSEWTSARNWLALPLSDSGNEALVILPSVHEAQIGGSTLSSPLVSTIPVTKPLRTRARIEE